mmetsp:Transcript_28727/g.50545  ORF Transcript_28727/g.50545 Transcript_28727/m.50545 type:complete len:425 (-) Transcript_28727:396-1670(-)|eukprot:CAMPEP_0197533838 /NCGR_PEP_ID=MMETSP1318-20131121/44860_1 /TAXON_ID=552666 /ORGANISM="Partenskyella glossopodia, Strain RCC365" /LENGTH=424 /DNA_ID=CAMNT_0043090869 /DNA_START=80 /DNA_END=1354 /DNA_ORIENTATION=-
MQDYMQQQQASAMAAYNAQAQAWQQQQQTAYLPMGYGPVRTGARGQQAQRANPYARSELIGFTLNSRGLPLRTGCKPCTYYEKTGRCNYGAECRWDHPEEVIQKMSEEAANVSVNSKGYPLRPDVETCKYYSQWGTCSFGKTCRWNHPDGIQGTHTASAVNSGGLPIRPEEKVCVYYVKTGTCKFAQTCKFNHPEVVTEEMKAEALAQSENKQDYANGAGPQIGATMQPAENYGALPTNEKGHPSRPGAPECTFYLKTGNCKFGLGCKFDHPFNIAPNPAAGVQGGGQTGYGKTPDGYNSKGYPVRYGEPECQYFMKSGECKFGQTCRFNHPEHAAVGVMLNSKGYPMRPGFPACQFFTKTGECKFGQTCKFDHPESAVGGAGGVNQSAMAMLRAANAQMGGGAQMSGSSTSGWDQAPAGTYQQ